MDTPKQKGMSSQPREGLSVMVRYSTPYVVPLTMTPSLSRNSTPDVMPLTMTPSLSQNSTPDVMPHTLTSPYKRVPVEPLNFRPLNLYITRHHFLTISVLLVPPKPKEFDKKVLILASRVFFTMFNLAECSSGFSKLILGAIKLF